MDNGINIRSIAAFADISEDNIQRIRKEAEYFKLEMGRPIFDNSKIPGKVFLIISGEARILSGNLLNGFTISIIGANNFIGLQSLLNVRGCETITARKNLILMTLSDNLILDLYLNEKSFNKWCNANIKVPDVLILVDQIYENSTIKDIKKKEILQQIINNSSLKIIDANTKYNKGLEDCKSFLISGNINYYEAGSELEDGLIIQTRGPLPARVIEIPINIYNELLHNNKDQENNREEKKLEIMNIQEMPDSIPVSTQELGQYEANKSFKVIKASGIIRESMACLQMLARELNLPYRSDSIEKMLGDLSKRGKEPTIELLGGITSSMGLHSTIAKVGSKMATKIPNLSIISWNKTFALVKEGSNDYLDIISPVDGEIRLFKEDLDASFDNNIIEILLVEKTEQTPNSKFGIKWLLPAINKYKSVLIQVLIASFVVQLFGLASPLMFQVIIDKVISQRSLDTLQILGIALVFITILGGILSSLRTFLFTETTNRIDTRLGAEVIDHLLRLPLKYFDKKPVGELGTRIAELEKIRNFLTGQALTTILDAIFSLIYIVVMVIYSWQLTLIALGVVPVQIAITVLGAPLIRKQIRDVAQQNAITQSHLVEVLTGVQTVKAQNVENVSRWKWQELYTKYISRSFQKTITGTALGETSKVLQQLSQLLILWVGASQVLEGNLSLGQLIAFRIISGYVTQPLLRLSTIWQNIQELKVSFERLADIIDTPEEASEKERSKIPLPSVDGTVEIENVSFSFNYGQPDVLKNINLSVKSGQFVGIVGQSGSGKSTLMKLLPRLYSPRKGRLIIDGYDVNKVELYSLRRQVGIVPQEPLLFAGTVSENIALTDPDAPSDLIVKAAKIADAHDFIMQLKDGYSTDVGERGAGLSGGQRQRIAIARTLLGNPKLLIMDEATSALDYQTERKVCEGIKENCKNSTVFFITHRLSTVKNADTIVMLHNGNIVEKGDHEELMKLQGRYYALYRQQESK